MKELIKTALNDIKGVSITSDDTFTCERNGKTVSGKVKMNEFNVITVSCGKTATEHEARINLSDIPVYGWAVCWLAEVIRQDFLKSYKMNGEIL